MIDIFVLRMTGLISNLVPVTLYILIATFLVACERENLNDQPVSYWINNQDSCVSGMAQAIVDSGEPYPNFIYESRLNPKTGKEEKKLKTFDLWLGTERYRIPAEYIYYRGGYAKNHPYRYMGLSGSLPNFYPKGKRAGVKDGMGSMVNVRFQCSMEKSYENTWETGARTNRDGITGYTNRMQKRTDQWNKQFEISAAQVSVSIRDDLQMTEVLWDTDSIEKKGGPYRWEAAYWPLDKEMTAFDNSVSGIGCKIRHDPIEKRYGKIGWVCNSSLRVNKNVSAQIEIYVSHIEAMPAIYQQVKQLLMDSKIQE